MGVLNFIADNPGGTIVLGLIVAGIIYSFIYNKQRNDKGGKGDKGGGSSNTPT